MSSTVARFGRGLGTRGLLAAAGLGTVLLFLFAVKLLGAATDAAAPVLARLLVRVVIGDAPALGLSWLAAYALGNGSVVAALGLSLFAAGLLSPPHLFLTVAGSRLGAAGIVLFIGALDYLGKERYTLQESVRMGLLTFLLTLSVYVPVTVVGYLLLPHVGTSLVDASRSLSLGGRWLLSLDPVTDVITGAIGPGPSFVLAIALLFGSLKLFDELLGRVSTRTLRTRFFRHLRRRWSSFAVGLLVTGLTTSVAFSLGVFVPLYNRGYIKREELVPYVLGANIGTLLDTLLVAIILDSPTGVAVVLVLLALATVLTLVVLLVHDPYVGAVNAVYEHLQDDRRAFVAFVAVLLALPFLLLLPVVIR